MIGPFARIFLRYLAGFLLIKGVIPQDIADQLANDPDLILLVGAGIALGVEGFYAVAKRMGWRT
jgi:hypothetical protein